MGERHYENETAVDRIDDDSAGDTVRWGCIPSDRWNLGDNANGGYALAPVVRALAEHTGMPDPLSLTTHFLRPLQPDGGPATITTTVVRQGRTLATVEASLRHAGAERLRVLGAFGDLGRPAGGFEAELTLPPPPMPPPADCPLRSGDDQGIDTPINQRVEVRLDPDLAVPGPDRAAEMRAWVRLVDGSPPTTRLLATLADTVPPSVFTRYGRIGWVPTIELTTQVRRRPSDGWILVATVCDDLTGGRMIETGSLWDSTGTLVARSRQLGLVRAP